MAFQVGQSVEWNWGNGTATGKVTQIYTRKITKTIKGTDVTRNGYDEDPALLIEQADGSQVLKSSTELSAA
ncbi:DUF2945 domain-containing protein [Dinoroseobacter sp. S76]|uniref:DUF2945 domain-containing protein n=1 Tax=Dinoroseobacter sp. S76 TaxID=3415124 RepID=UPI003C7E6623